MNGDRDETDLRRWALPIVAVMATLVALLVSPGSASAHRNDESYLYLDVSDSSLSGTVQMPYRDLRTVLDLKLSGSAAEVNDEIESELGRIHDYAAAHTSVGAAGEVWQLTFTGFSVLNERSVPPDGLGYVVLPFVVDLGGADVPQLLEVEFTPMLSEIDGRNNIVLVGNDWKRGVFNEEANELLVVDLDRPSGTIDLGESSHWKNFSASIDLGVDHIRTGPDHIFFVFVLLLPSVLVLAAAWRPAPSFTGSLVRVVVVATMFTIAHSLTFTLAGLEILPLPPSKFVETLIALSIAAAALHNLRPVLGHREWAIAFVFGLFHGMGFAGLVEDLDIDRTTQLVSLLGRNVGIEIGQLVIILITFPGLFLLRRTQLYMPVFRLASTALAVLSSLWIIERIWEVDLRINGKIDKVLLWPRSFFIALAFTALSAVVHQITPRRGALLPVGERGGSDDMSEQAGDTEPESALVSG